MPTPGVGIHVLPVRRKTPLPPPSAVSIRVLQGKRFGQFNVASSFLQILSKTFVLQDEEPRNVWGVESGADGRACPPEPRRSRHRPWRRGFGLPRSARSRSSSHLLGARSRFKPSFTAPNFRWGTAWKNLEPTGGLEPPTC